MCRRQRALVRAAARSCFVVWVMLGLWCVGAPAHAAGKGPLRGWLKQLSSPVLVVRERAERKIMGLGPAAWPGVSAALGVSSTKLRLAAAYIATKLASRKGTRRKGPWRGLWQRLQRERDDGVRRYLIDALGGWKTPPTAFYQRLKRFALVAKDSGVRQVALKALAARRGSLSLWLAVWKKRLGATSWRRRRAAFQMMARVLKGWRKRLRRRAKGGAVVMPKALSSRRLLPLFRRGLKDPMLRVRSAAAIAASALRGGARPLFGVLKTMLSHRSWRLRYAGAEAFHLLGRLSRPAASALVGGLGDANWGVRYSSSHALARIGAPILPLLQKALKDTSARARLTATDTLLRMKLSRPPRLYIRLLRRQLRDPKAIIRFAAIRGLRRFAKRAGGKSLALASRDRDWRVREAALQALAKLPYSAGRLRVVKRRLRDASGAVREAATGALGRWSSPQVQTLLRRALVDRHSLVRSRACLALLGRTLSSKSIDALVGVYASSHPGVKAAALAALATGGAASRRRLASWMKGSSRRARSAALALLLWGAEPTAEAVVARHLQRPSSATVGAHRRAMQQSLVLLQQWLAMLHTARNVRATWPSKKSIARLRALLRQAGVHPSLRSRMTRALADFSG